jgi:hypothetical protein
MLDHENAAEFRRDFGSQLPFQRSGLVRKARCRLLPNILFGLMTLDRSSSWFQD